MCYTLNGALICHEKRPRYFENQYEYRCGLHAINNLLQNQSIVSGLPIIKYTQLLDSCRRFGKYYYEPCNPKGFFSIFFLEFFFNNFSYLTAKIGTGSLEKYLDFMHAHHNLILGAIVMYRAPNCYSHFVSLIYENGFFLVIDSEYSKARAFDTKKEIIKYFYTFEYILLVAKRY